MAIESHTNALNIFPVLKKFGEKLPRECIPKWRFEGKGMFSKVSRQKQTAQWLAQNKSVAYINIHHNFEESLDDWGTYNHTKCLSTMFLQRVSLEIHENNQNKDFEFGLYKNEVRIRKLFTFDANTTPTWFSVDDFVDLSMKLDFDQEYAWGFQTVDGSFPTFNDTTVRLSYTINCLVVLGAGDP